MAKDSTTFVCQSCGAVSRKWSGQCADCGAWNSIVEESGGANAVSFSRVESARAKTKEKILDIASLAGAMTETPRRQTGIAELDRVLGGGLVKGSAILIGGDPGIGKSTLLLQATASLTGVGQSCLYVTGEESVEQVRLRARRLGLGEAEVQLAAASAVEAIMGAIRKHKPDVVVVDSIQTMFLEVLESAPGTVSQVRAAAHELIQCAKQTGSVLLLVGHVTKEGQIAGPKVLEHMVDTVLYFEGERGHNYRILRAVKNRFGGAGEIGVFEMSDKGLQEVSNPSSLFIPGKAGGVSGSVIFAGVEGTRPVLVEIQALVVPTGMATPRRAV
ncbi:MAG: DNA repair protein RadA, partial [Rickettsiales bacterium]|nr:DNA repair protein RadA [Rickettsiales bacterium]